MKEKGLSIGRGVARRNMFVMTISALIMSGLAAGCSDRNDGSKSEGQSKPAQAKPVELVFYALSALSGTDEEKAEQWTAYVQKKHPNISLKFINATDTNTVDNVIATKQPVDILFGSFANFLRFKDREMTGDMTELVKQNKFDLSSVEKQYVDMVQQYHDGKLPLLPVYDLRLGVYYNKDLFDKFGVPYPKDGTTWENLLDTARKLTREESGVTYRGFATASAGAGLAINQYSLGYTDPKTGKLAINTDQWKRYFAPIVPMFTVPGYNPTKEIVEGGLKLFEEGSAAMVIAFNSYGSFTLPSKNLNWDVTSLPEMSDLRGIGSQPYPVYLGLSSTSKHKDEAFQAISALLSLETQIDRSSKFGVFSPLKDQKAKVAFGESKMWKGKNFQAFAGQKPAAPAPAVNANLKNIAESELNKVFTSVITGEKDINTALREAEDATDKAYQQFLSQQSK
ncbi:carbohydrate ABC transporter substrate-binding protein [Paenibacillus mesophilus]|uniref:ABC transporter substrate-binding protein n=1 Tax=Paenibacillus mesophilus TaxID=2582849 RepID=UPI00110E92B4|nr:ABC transporter substrate-binding protein [Paenibacillus mesophilus]TMV43039.1 carbohydrate ABC transporter substrate-binding protein [Paenibacillus mesophilus]